MKKHRWISRQPNTAMSDCASLCSCFRHTDVMNELTKEHNTSLPTESKSLKFSAIPLKIFQLDLKPRCAEELLPLKKLDFLSRRSLMIPLLQGNLNEETFNLEVCLFYLENVKKWIEENKKSQKRLQRKIAIFLVKFINLSLGLFDKWLPTNFVRFLRCLRNFWHFAMQVCPLEFLKCFFLKFFMGGGCFLKECWCLFHPVSLTFLKYRLAYIQINFGQGQE